MMIKSNNPSKSQLSTPSQSSNWIRATILKKIGDDTYEISVGSNRFILKTVMEDLHANDLIQIQIQGNSITIRKDDGSELFPGRTTIPVDIFNKPNINSTQILELIDTILTQLDEDQLETVDLKNNLFIKSLFSQLEESSEFSNVIKNLTSSKNGDILEILENLKNRIQLSEVNLQKQQKSPPPNESVHLIKTKDDLENFILGKTVPEEIKNEIEKKITNYENVYIQKKSTDGKDNFQILTKSDLNNLIEKFKLKLVSPLLNKFTSEDFQLLLNKQNSLSFTLIQSADFVLSKLVNSEIPQRLQESHKQVLLQWMSLLQVNPEISDSLLKLKPILDSTLLTKNYISAEQLLPSLKIEPNQFSALTPGIIEHDIATIDKKDLVNSIILRLGLNFENRIINNEIDNGTDNLKMLLLELKHKIQNGSILNSMNSQLPNKSPSELVSSRANLPDALNSLLFELNPDSQVSLPKENIRQSIETLIQNIESLQVLASKVNLPDSTQQVLALPIKIQNEWTQLSLTFVKEKNKSDRTKQQHFTVSVHVNPSVLGAIDATMEYDEKKLFSLHINFEQKETYEFFQNFMEPLKDSLITLGLPSPIIQFYLTKKNPPDINGNNSESSDKLSLIKQDTCIDFKV